ncbi:MAG: hypothetical protein E6J20_00490 [Chloroflexi bacterium]|nr:MAG: hypothetical protein E6J20_00490 [Chloroflexota bacterium]
MSAVAEELLQDTTGEVVSEGQPAGTRREDDTHQAEFDIQAETEERRQALEAQERAEEERTRIETQAVATGLVRIGGVWKEPQQAPASHRIAEEIERIDAELDATDRNKLKSRKASLERQMQEAIRQELQAVPRPEELNEIIERQHELDAAADEALATLIDAIDATLAVAPGTNQASRPWATAPTGAGFGCSTKCPPIRSRRACWRSWRP